VFGGRAGHVEDQRLRAIADANSRAKEHSRAIAPSLVLDLTQAIARGCSAS
jgi:diacylglycerol O-acyltransferase